MKLWSKLGWLLSGNDCQHFYKKHRLLFRILNSYNCENNHLFSFLAGFLPFLVGILAFLALDYSSTSKASSWRVSGRITYLMELPRRVSWSRVMGFFYFTVIFTFCKNVFILISTPWTEPTTIVPFLSSIVTVSFFNFIRNLTNFILLFPLLLVLDFIYL